MKRVWSGSPPKCDIDPAHGLLDKAGHTKFVDGQTGSKFIDGKTVMGPWAMMSPASWAAQGVDLAVKTQGEAARHLHPG